MSKPGLRWDLQKAKHHRPAACSDTQSRQRWRFTELPTVVRCHDGANAFQFGCFNVQPPNYSHSFTNNKMCCNHNKWKHRRYYKLPKTSQIHEDVFIYFPRFWSTVWTHNLLLFSFSLIDHFHSLAQAAHNAMVRTMVSEFAPTLIKLLFCSFHQASSRCGRPAIWRIAYSSANQGGGVRLRNSLSPTCGANL